MASKKAGGAKGGTNESMDNNIYFIPETAKYVIEKISPHFPVNPNFILDACANDGVLGEAVYNWYREHDQGHLAQVFYQDIKFESPDDKQIGGDILTFQPKAKFDFIICNPPWIPVTLAESIYHHLFDLVSNSGLLVFIINNTFLYQGWERAIKLNYNDVYFLPRYIFDYGINKIKKKKANKGQDTTILLDACVMICKKGIVSNKYVHVPRDVMQPRLI